MDLSHNKFGSKSASLLKTPRIIHYDTSYPAPTHSLSPLELIFDVFHPTKGSLEVFKDEIDNVLLLDRCKKHKVL